MPRRLTKLQIAEVSSVPKGAGVGVTVQLRKADQMQLSDLTKANPTLHLSLLCQKLNKDLASGAIDNVTYASHQTELAKLAFPNEPTVSATLRKFFESSIGREMLATVRQPGAAAMADTYAKRGKTYDGGSADALVTHDMGQGADQIGADDYAKAIKTLVGMGMSFTEAAGRVADQERKNKLGGGF